MGFLSSIFKDEKKVKSNSTQSGTQEFGLSPEVKKYWESIGGSFDDWKPVESDPYQTAAAQAQAGYASGLNPAFAGAVGIGQTGIDPNSIARFQNPYENQVVRNTLDDMRYADSQALGQINASAAKMGALGGSGGIVRRNLAEEGFQDARNKAITGIRQQGFNTAADLATKSTQAQLAGYGAASGIAGQQAGINKDAFGMGTQFWNQGWQNAMMPYQLRQQGAGILGSLAGVSGQATTGNSSGTQTTTGSPSPFSIFSNLAGLGISAFSDERIKENIVPIGESFDGQPIYKFNYKGDPRSVIGLMAQDVEEHTPEAVGDVGGIKTVNYDRALAEAEPRAARSAGGAVSGGRDGGSDPHAKFRSAFEAISGMIQKARGGSVSGMMPAHADGGSIGPWSTTVTPSPSFDMKKFGQGLQSMGQQGRGGEHDTSLLQGQQQSLAGMLSGMTRRAAGGGIWDETGPEFGGSSGLVPPMRLGAAPDRVERRALPAPRRPWTAEDETWQSLSAPQRAAAMGLLEADGRDPVAARNAVSAMINRANRTGEDLGAHVSRPIYQPTIEPAQRARLQSVLSSPAYKELSQWTEDRILGRVPDTVGGNTHFLAHEPVMEKLTAREPGKYRSWPGWSGYNRGGGQYTNPDGSPVARDKSHAFLSPEGRFDGGDPSRDLDENPGPLPPLAPSSTMVASGARGPAPVRVASVEPTSASATVATDAPKRGGWFSEGIWSGEKMTPMQRLGIGLMSVRGPMFGGPLNDMAKQLMSMEEGRLNEKRIDNQADQFAKQIAQQAAIAAGRLPDGTPTVQARQAEASIADAAAARRLQEANVTGVYDGKPTVAGQTAASNLRTAEMVREAKEIELDRAKNPEKTLERRKELADRYGLTGDQRTQYIFDGKIPDKTAATESTETKEVTKAAVEMAQKNITSGQGARDSLKLIDELSDVANDPNLEGAIGPLDQYPTAQTLGSYVPFAGKSFVNPELNAKIRRIQQQLTLAGGEKMKGLGAQSDADAKRLEEAVSNLTAARNKKEFTEALRVIEEGVSASYNRAVDAARKYPKISEELAKAPRRDLEARKAAREAIAKGANPEAVKRRLIENGIDAGGL